jgi:hypothetical protein
MNTTKHLSRTALTASTVATVPAPRVPGHDNLVIENLSEFALGVPGSCSGYCWTDSTALSSPGH